MADEHPPVVFDDDNPEWTEEDFARARRGSEVLPKAFLDAFTRKPGRPTGSTKSDAKKQVTIRLDRDVLEKLRAGGPGWQSRLNDVLRKALGV